MTCGLVDVVFAVVVCRGGEVLVVTQLRVEQSIDRSCIPAGSSSMCGIAQSCSHAGGSFMYMLWHEDTLYQLPWDHLRMSLMLGG